jgi:glycosyltransferase involved in cell wall biosynthesis
MKSVENLRSTESIQEGIRVQRICLIVSGDLQKEEQSNLLTEIENAFATRTADVTVLLVDSQDNLADSRFASLNKDIKVAHLPDRKQAFRGSNRQVQAYLLYNWLKQKEFDVVVLSDRFGLGYYAILAKHQGLYFQNTSFCINVLGPTLWSNTSNGNELSDPEVLTTDFMERASIASANRVNCTNNEIRNWMEQNGWSFPATPKKENASRTTSNLPVVTVCITHYNRPTLLRQALDSLQQQNYPNLEVIIIDNGSKDATTIADLKELQTEISYRNWTICFNDNVGVGAARNEAARRARGEYLLFMDDDNYAKPEEVSTLVNVAIHAGAQIVTCFMDVFSTLVAPAPNQIPDITFLFLGAALPAGYFKNVFGDTNALVHRHTFLQLGGFSEEASVRFEDWKFYAEAVMKGIKLEVAPESLFWYRKTGIRKSTSLSASKGLQLVRAAYKNADANSLFQLLSVSQAMNNQLTIHAVEVNAQNKALTTRTEQIKVEKSTLIEKHNELQDRHSQAKETITVQQREIELRGEVLDRKRSELKDIRNSYGKQTELFESLERVCTDYEYEITKLQKELHGLRESSNWKSMIRKLFQRSP